MAMTPDRVLTPVEIRRTAFKAVGGDKAGDGYTHPGRDANEMCIYCKNEATDRVTDAGYLAPFAKEWGSSAFKVMSCHCCSAVFSFGVRND